MLWSCVLGFLRFYTFRCPGPPRVLTGLAGDLFMRAAIYGRVTLEAGPLVPGHTTAEV